MKPTAFYFFEHTPPGARRPKRTTYRMTIKDAAARVPGAIPLEWSKEMRNLPENEDELAGVSNTGRLYSTKGRPG